jgi:cell division protein FtsI (penicillin-binding protein 3)
VSSPSNKPIPSVPATRAKNDVALVSDPFKGRVTALMVGCFLFAGAVLVRAASVQVMSHPKLEKMARRQFQSKVLIRPRRGEITDRNGARLAINVEASSLAANPSKVKNPRALARLLSRATDVPHKKILQRLQGGKEFVWIKRHLTDAEMQKLRKWRVIDSDGELEEGLMTVRESKRVYPNGELASHLLGDVNVDSEGLEGVELWQNDRMRGKVLSVNAIRDAMGRPTFIDAVSAKNVQEHKDGETVKLTIDSSLQFSVEEELKAAVHKTSAKAGSVIVMNAVSGEVLAMANYPQFNPNEPTAPADHRRNRVLTDGYEPGSTLKAVLAASYLARGGKATDQVWGEMGKGLSIQGRRIHEAESHEKFGFLSLSKMLAVSSNVGAAKFALNHGADSFYDSLKGFGFGAKTASGFPGEISGQIPPRKSWQPITLANIGFGHGVLVTPMQMARAYAVFVNGGWLVQPKLIVEDAASIARGASEAPMRGFGFFTPANAEPQDAPRPAVKPEPPRRVISEELAAEMLEMLEGPMQEGNSGFKANLNGYRIAGKTGTAQKVDPVTRAYSRSSYVASFIGTAVGVEPKLVILTSIDEPRGVYYASETAAPLFREVLNAVATRFSIPVRPDTPNRVVAEASKPHPTPALSKTAAALAKIGILSDALKASSAKSKPPAVVAPSELQWQGMNPAGRAIWTMPSLKGLTPREALQALQGHHFQMEMKGVGLIRGQVPAEGAPLAEGETIKVSLAEP